MSEFEFLRDVTIGQYLPTDSALHHLDPRAKLLMITFFLIGIVFGNSVSGLLAALGGEFGPHCYRRIDAHYPLEKRGPLMELLKGNPPARLLRSPLADVKSYDGVKFVARDGSWLMLRGSGTEPILRIYAEAGSDADARRLLRLGVRLAGQA